LKDLRVREERIKCHLMLKSKTGGASDLTNSLTVVHTTARSLTMVFSMCSVEKTLVLAT